MRSAKSAAGSTSTKGTDVESVWLFLGDGARFPAAVFADEDDARRWIRSQRVSGILTEYPIGISVLEWATAKDFVDGAASKFSNPKVVQRFSSANQKHSHYVDGVESNKHDLDPCD